MEARGLGGRVRAVVGAAMLSVLLLPAGAYATWDPSTPFGHYAQSPPPLAVDGQDNAYSAYSYDGGTSGNNQVFVAERLRDGSPSGPVEVSNQSFQAFGPAIASDAAGDLVVAWWGADDSHAIYASVRPAGGSFSAPIRVGAPTVAVFSGPSSLGVAMDPAGDAVIAWDDGGTTQAGSANADPNTFQIHAVTRAVRGGSFANASFAAPVTVYTPPSGDTSSNAAVGMLDSGTAVLTWQAKHGDISYPQNDTREIEASTLDLGASAASAPTVVAAPGEPTQGPVMAADGNGHALVAWTTSATHNGGGQPTVVQAASYGGNSWAPPKTIAGPAIFGYPLSVTLGPGGQGAVSWDQESSSNNQTSIYAARFNGTSGSFSAPIQAPSSLGSIKPAAGMDGAGNLVVAWQSPDPYQGYGHYDIVSAALPAGNSSFGDVEPVHGGYQRPQEPSIAIEPSGHGVAAWNDDSGLEITHYVPTGGPDQPSATLTTPADGDHYVYGQVVHTSFSCVSYPTGTLQSCTGQDEAGNQYASGAALATGVVGSHTFTATATAQDGTTASVRHTYNVDRAPTVLKANPLIVQALPGAQVYLTAGATLTYDGGTPAAGRRIQFSTGSLLNLLGSANLCTAETDSSGHATCSITATPRGALGLGYQAAFAGDTDLLASSTTAGLAIVNGNHVP